MKLFEDRLHVGLLEANRPADVGAIRREVDGIREMSILISPPENEPEKTSQVALSFKIGEFRKPVVTSFCGADISYPVFRDERDFLKSRHEKMGIPVGSLEDCPTTKNQLVGLCLSGGGIRSATFSLGFIQALFRSCLLKRVDYLSTVSGGGYIGSCLTALLSSSIENVDKEIKKTSKEKKTPLLWDECNFPFAMPKLQKKVITYLKALSSAMNVFREKRNQSQLKGNQFGVSGIIQIILLQRVISFKNILAPR